MKILQPTKKIGNLIPEIITLDNIKSAVCNIIDSPEKRNSFQGKQILENLDEFASNLAQSLAKGEFELGKYHTREIKEGPKIRVIQVFSIKSRIALSAVMNVIDSRLESRYIRTTGSAIKERGAADMLNYIRRTIKNDPEGTKYVYKADIRKFYESIPHNVLKLLVRKYFPEWQIRKILDKCIEAVSDTGKGISIGLRSSQALANLLLSDLIDHYFKDFLGVPYYFRYCDDIVFLSDSKEKLWKYRNILHEKIESIGLEIKKSEAVFPITNGLDFLGYVIYPTHVKLRKRIKKSFAKKLSRIKSKRRSRELMGSFYGMCKHGNCAHLFYVVIRQCPAKPYRYIKRRSKKFKTFGR